MFTLSYLTRHPACMICCTNCSTGKPVILGIYSGPIFRPSRVKCSFSLGFTPTLSVHWFPLSYKRRKKCQTKKVTTQRRKEGLAIQTMQIPLKPVFFINGATNDLKPSHNDTSISLSFFSPRDMALLPTVRMCSQLTPGTSSPLSDSAIPGRWKF